MNQEDKQLLLKDLSARQPWGVKVQYNNKVYAIDYISAEYKEVKLDILDNYTVGISDIKPFLRPMSSMTKEEKHTIFELFNNKYVFITNDGVNADDQFTPIWRPFWLQGISFKTMSKITDYLNSIHVDYRGLIPMGLAIEAPKDMYKL